MKSTKWRALEKGVLHLSKGQIGQSSSSVSSVMTLWQQACKLHLWGNINRRKMTTDCFTSNDIEQFESEIDEELRETTINSSILLFPLPSVWRKLSPKVWHSQFFTSICSPGISSDTNKKNISGCLVKETNPHLSTTTFQGVEESGKVTSESPFLQAEQPQLPQPFLIEFVFQVLHQPCYLLRYRPGAIGLLGHQGTLLAHVQPAVDQ
ncbi:hypothetical protein TURU_032086 [Turdus rufiventris]|nr:hypothetical protein TURU_032086 [Turdus rufiventris]